MPASSIPAKACEAAAARTASTATWMLPSVRFLNPIGIERPEASWRCVWLSEVRAPIAPQPTAVGDVLRRDRVEELAADRQPGVQHLEQQLAGDPQAGVDVAAFVQVRVVDQSLPAGRRPRLLEVDAHHHQQLVAQRPRGRAQPRRVLHRRFRVVDAARPDHDHQPRVLPRQHVAHFLAAADDRFRPLLAERQLLEQPFRRRQLDDFRDPLVADAVSFRPLHPDEHFAFAFLQTEEIVLSGRSLPDWGGAHATQTLNGARPEDVNSSGG